jgi:hypothetical protein
MNPTLHGVVASGDDSVAKLAKENISVFTDSKAK